VPLKKVYALISRPFLESAGSFFAVGCSGFADFDIGSLSPAKRRNREERVAVEIDREVAVYLVNALQRR
jgi:hypothetical protein